MRHSHIINWINDRSFCFISALFRSVTEEHGVDLNTKNYAQMKRNACQARARNLRLWVHPSPSSDNGNSSVRCVNVTYFDSFFSPVGGSPSRALQCSPSSPSPPPRYASAQMQSQVRRTQSTNSAFSNKSPAGMCIPLGYKPRGYNSFGLSSLKIPRVVLSVSPGRYLTFFV